MYQSVRAAAISLKPKKWDKPYNADKMEAFFVEAARDRPDLILTTEGGPGGCATRPVAGASPGRWVGRLCGGGVGGWGGGARRLGVRVRGVGGGGAGGSG